MTEFVVPASRQLSRHELVSSAFTAICVFRRAVLERWAAGTSGGSPVRRRRVHRFVLPPSPLAYVGAAVRTSSGCPQGLLKHRFNVGFFFVSSVAARDRAEGKASWTSGTPSTPRPPWPPRVAPASPSRWALELLLAPLSVVPAGDAGRGQRALAPECGPCWPRPQHEAFLLSAMEGYSAGVVAAPVASSDGGSNPPPRTPPMAGRTHEPPLAHATPVRPGGAGERRALQAPVPHRLRRRAAGSTAGTVSTGRSWRTATSRPSSRWTSSTG